MTTSFTTMISRTALLALTLCIAATFNHYCVAFVPVTRSPLISSLRRTNIDNNRVNNKSPGNNNNMNMINKIAASLTPEDVEKLLDRSGMDTVYDLPSSALKSRSNTNNNKNVVTAATPQQQQQQDSLSFYGDVEMNYGRIAMIVAVLMFGAELFTKTSTEELLFTLLFP